jgi:hypothetical protein
MESARKRQQRTEIVERLNGGKLRIERRNGSPNLYAAAYLQGKNVIKSTGEDTPNAARKAAFRWYGEQLDRIRKGEHLHGRLFADSVEAFLKHADEVGEVSEGQRRNYRQKWSLLKRHFENVKVADVDARFVMTLRKTRADATTKQGKRVTNATLKKDQDFVRLVLRHAHSWEKCIDSIPQFPSFSGRTWKVLPTRRPFLTYEQWKAVRALAHARAFQARLNPRTERQRKELYCFLMLCVGGALRIEEAHSLRWMDCGKPYLLNDADHTEVVQVKVFGKHSELTGKREDAWLLYDGAIGFKELQSLRPDAKPEDNLFLEKHRDGMRELLMEADLRANVDGITRDSKSLRQTGISMRLDLGKSPDYRDIAKWARTSVGQIGRFYDQSHPEQSVERITGFRKVEPKNEKERARMEKSAKSLARLQKAVQEHEDPRHEWERKDDDD